MLVKQLKLDAKALIKFQLLIVFLADLSLATSSSIPEISSSNRPSVEHGSENPYPPFRFPDLEYSSNSTKKPWPIILHSNQFMETSNKTAMDIIKKRLNVERNENLTETAVISNNNNDQMKNATPIGNPSNATEGDLKTIVIMKTEISKRTAIILLTVVANASIVFYLLSVFIRKILERKYGDRELLVHEDEKSQDYTNC